MKNYLVFLLICLGVAANTQNVENDVKKLKNLADSKKYATFDSWANSNQKLEYFQVCLRNLKTASDDKYIECLLEAIQTILSKSPMISEVEKLDLRAICRKKMAEGTDGQKYTCAAIFQYIYIGDTFSESCNMVKGILESKKVNQKESITLLFDGLLKQMEEQHQQEQFNELQNLYEQSKGQRAFFESHWVQTEHRSKYWRLLFQICENLHEVSDTKKSAETKEILQDFLNFTPNSSDFTEYREKIESFIRLLHNYQEILFLLNKTNKDYLQSTLDGKIAENKTELQNNYQTIIKSQVDLLSEEANFQNYKLQKGFDYFGLPHQYLATHDFFWYINEAEILLSDMSRIEDKLVNLYDKKFNRRMTKIELQELDDTLSIEQGRAELEIFRESKGYESIEKEVESQKLRVLLQNIVLENSKLRLYEIESRGRQLELQKIVQDFEMKIAKLQKLNASDKEEISKKYLEIAQISIEIQKNRVKMAKDHVKAIRDQLRLLKRKQDGRLFGALANAVVAGISTGIGVAALSIYNELRGDSASSVQLDMQKSDWRAQLLRAQNQITIEEKLLDKDEINKVITEMQQKVSQRLTQIAEHQISIQDNHKKQIEEQIEAWHFEKQRHQNMVEASYIELQEANLRLTATQKKMEQAHSQKLLAERRKDIVTIRNKWRQTKIQEVLQNDKEIEVLIDQKEQLLGGYYEMVMKYIFLASKIYNIETNEYFLIVPMKDADQLRFLIKKMKDEYNKWSTEYDKGKYIFVVNLSENMLDSLRFGGEVSFTFTNEESLLRIFQDKLNYIAEIKILGKILNDQSVEQDIKKDIAKEKRPWKKKKLWDARKKELHAQNIDYESIEQDLNKSFANKNTPWQKETIVWIKTQWNLLKKDPLKILSIMEDVETKIQEQEQFQYLENLKNTCQQVK